MPELATGTLSTAALKLASNVLEALAKSRLDKGRDRRSIAVEVDTPEILAYHLQDVSGWSSHVQFYGMTSPAETDFDTVSLTFDAPRRFRSEAHSAGHATEADLIRGFRN